MCDFFSWIEHKGKLYYITDKNYHSVRGWFKRTFGNSNYGDNKDFIGHGAIQGFFFLGDKGRHCEEDMFWETERLPMELRKLIKTEKVFLKNFGTIFKECVDYDQKRNIKDSNTAPKWLKKLC